MRLPMVQARKQAQTGQKVSDNHTAYQWQSRDWWDVLSSREIRFKELLRGQLARVKGTHSLHTIYAWPLGLMPEDPIL